MDYQNSNPFTKLVQQRVPLDKGDFLTLMDTLSCLFDQSIRLDDLIKVRYMDSRSLLEVINPSDHTIDGMIIIQTLDTLQDEVCRDETQSVLYWKMVSALILQSLSKRPNQNGVTSVVSRVTGPPKVGSVKVQPRGSTTLPNFVDHFALCKPSVEPVAEQVLKQLSELRLSTIKPLYRNKYHYYIRCRSSRCDFCLTMFYHMSLTSCISLHHGDIPCHHTGYFPHVGLRLWKQLRTRHDSGEPFKPTARSRELKYTLFSYEQMKGLETPCPIYDDKIDTDTPVESQMVNNTDPRPSDEEVIYCPLSPEIP